MDLVVTLAEAARLGPLAVGAKAATLGRLAGHGLRVPAGIVVTPDGLTRWDQAEPALAAALAGLGPGPFAVRSSGSAEDLPGASFAGQYETELGVPAAGVAAAVRRVAASGSAGRVAAYRRAHRPGTGPAPVAVLVQPLLPAAAAGVAFSADPVTGARDLVVLSAVRGLGERLVAGEAVGDEWVVRGRRATCRRATEQALRPGQARAVAALARRAEALLGAPQDIEWAIADGRACRRARRCRLTGGRRRRRLWLLQARPVTALPEPVHWPPPRRGWWRRDFRLGEWLPEPLTPLFADWLLPALERGAEDAMAASGEAGLRFDWALVNGWYYTTPTPRPAAGSLGRHLLRHPRALLGLPALARLLLRPDLATAQVARLSEHWRGQLLPAYRDLVAAAEADLERAAAPEPGELAATIDALAAVAGAYLWSTWVLAGSAWKVEATLARFCHRHLPGLGVSAQLLASGLPGAAPGHDGHAVQSLDWAMPTLGETGPVRAPAAGLATEAGRRHEALVARRQAAEAACRAALAGRPRLARRFERLLAATQRFAVVREQQTRALSLGWPLLRRCVLGLAEPLRRDGRLAGAGDGFFCTRAELLGAGRAGLQATVERRRARWRAQRALRAPLQLGRPPALAALLLRRRFAGYATPAARPAAGALLTGQAASPGRATGSVRVLDGPGSAAGLRPGEVLVARATTPAWTPLFAVAAAVVTDSGTLAAHASLVAREYGIPAVVGTGDATSRLRSGQLVTVDGDRGAVLPAAAGGPTAPG